MHLHLTSGPASLIRLRPSASASTGSAIAKTVTPPMIIKIPAMMINPPNPLEGSFLEMKNAIIGKIMDGNPRPNPRAL